MKGRGLTGCRKTRFHLPIVSVVRWRCRPAKHETCFVYSPGREKMRIAQDGVLGWRAPIHPVP